MNRQRASADVELSGRRFGRLVAIAPADSRNRATMWLCRCDCGAEKDVRSAHLQNGRVVSCGGARCKNNQGALRHGFARTGNIPEYYTWQAMLNRCRNPKVSGFESYGGRGITVCERWQAFENFYADMGDRPSPKHSIDRIDNDGNYEPSNCRWATRLEQAANKRNAHLLAHMGVRLPVAEWARRLGIPRQTIHTRLRAGWPTARVLATGTEQ